MLEQNFINFNNKFIHNLVETDRKTKEDVGR